MIDPTKKAGYEIKEMKKIFLTVASLSLFIGCASISSEKGAEKEYKIQSTKKLNEHFDNFIKAYNSQKPGLDDFFSESFVLETVRPVTHHREIDFLSELNANGLRKSLFGKVVKVIDTTMMKPWVLSLIEINIGGKKIKDFVVIHINDQGKIEKIVSFWSKGHFEVSYKTKIQADNRQRIKRAQEAILRGYNKGDLKSAFSVIPDFIVFEKMNPFGVRDISMPGHARKDYLKSRLSKKELLSDKIIKQFILSPYSIYHVIIKDKEKILTERIVFRSFSRGKLVFTINFVGDEEHRLHKIDNFYKENPLYRYKRF